MKLLIQHGASPKHQDLMGFNCLALALKYHALACASWLLDQSFAVDLFAHVTKLEETLLHVAVDAFDSVESGSDSFCKVILYKIVQSSMGIFDRRSVENITAVEKALMLQRRWFISCITDYASAFLIDLVIRRAFDAECPILLYADPNCTDHRHHPILYVAVWLRDVAAVQYLVAAGADVNARSIDGWTPLLAAAYLGDGVICERLLQNSANVHTTLASLHNCTPLQLAASVGTCDVIVRLLSHGALLDGRNDLGLNALHLAVLHGHREAAFTLISSAKAAGKGNSGVAELLRTPEPSLMHRLICSDLPESVMMKCVNMLLLLGVPFDCEDSDGRTPLQLALAENLPLVAAALGSYTKSTGTDTRAAMFSAVDTCDSSALKMLLSRASDLNCKEFFDHGRPLLHALVRASCRKGDSVDGGMIDCISIVTGDPQCNIDVLDDQGCTPLHVAAALGCVAAAVVLLEAGALCDSTSLTTSALYVALSSGHFDCADRLLFFGANLMNPLGPNDSNSCVIAAVQSGRSAVVISVLNHLKANYPHQVRQVCESQDAVGGATLPLIWLENSKECDEDTLDVLKLLILGGSDILQCDHSSVFPLQIATARSFYQTSCFITSVCQSRLMSIITCQSLTPGARSDVLNCVSAGAQLECANEQGLLPLHICASLGSAVALEALMSTAPLQTPGAIDVVDARGHNALCHAVCNGRSDLIPILLRSNISQLASCGCSALAHAVSKQNAGCIRVLLATGNAQSGQDVAMVNSQNSCLGVNALQLACLFADVDMVNTLLERSLSSHSLCSMIYADGGSIIHYLASLQHHKHLSADSSASIETISVRLSRALAHAGASFLRRNSQVRLHNTCFSSTHNAR
jgi:ankyrin repeat protein